MIRSRTIAALATALAVLTFAPVAWADGPQSFHCSGSGVFSPVNIGTFEGGSFGFVIGDGSGLTGYVAAGDTDAGTPTISDGDFLIGGQRVGATGFNLHTGTVFSRTAGIFQEGLGQVAWPGQSEGLHVISSDEGEIYLQYFGAFELDLAALFSGTPSFTGHAVAVVVGGTGRFAGASGIVWIDAVVPVALPVPPPTFVPAIPFNYDFNGFIVLHEN